MTPFYTLPYFLRSMFAAMLFAAVTGETALLIYKSHRSVRFEEKLVSLLSLFYPVLRADTVPAGR